MSETKVIEGRFSKVNTPMIVLIILSVLTLLYSFFCCYRAYTLSQSSYIMKTDKSMIGFGFEYGYFSPFLYVGLPLLILALVFFFWMSRCSIVVTDKRVYGRAAFGKRVDLPFDMISSVGSGFFNSISVATSSGRISFWLLSNRNEVFDAISRILMSRQENRKASMTTTIKQEIPKSNADELKKFKELLDSGIITQDEFDEQKKKILNL
jgi:hypothetical protein